MSSGMLNIVIPHHDNQRSGRGVDYPLTGCSD